MDAFCVDTAVSVIYILQFLNSYQSVIIITDILVLLISFQGVFVLSLTSFTSVSRSKLCKLQLLNYLKCQWLNVCFNVCPVQDLCCVSDHGHGIRYPSGSDKKTTTTKKHFRTLAAPIRMPSIWLVHAFWHTCEYEHLKIKRTIRTSL